MLKKIILAVPALMLSAAAFAGSAPTATGSASTATGSIVMPASVTAALQGKNVTASGQTAGPGTASIAVNPTQANQIATDLQALNGATVTRDAAGNVVSVRAVIQDGGQSVTVEVNTDTGVLTVSEA